MCLAAGLKWNLLEAQSTCHTPYMDNEEREGEETEIMEGKGEKGKGGN